MKLTREMKRANKKYHDKLVKTNDPYAKMEDRTDDFKRLLIREKKRSTIYVKSFLSNKVLSIQEMEYDDMFILGFRYNNEDIDLPWKLKQYWKNKLGYQDKFGYEAYPSESDLFDQANMYWLMIPKEDIGLNLKGRVFHPPLYK